MIPYNNLIAPDANAYEQTILFEPEQYRDLFSLSLIVLPGGFVSVRVHLYDQKDYAKQPALELAANELLAKHEGDPADGLFLDSVACTLATLYRITQSQNHGVAVMRLDRKERHAESVFECESTTALPKPPIHENAFRFRVGVSDSGWVGVRICHADGKHIHVLADTGSGERAIARVKAAAIAQRSYGGNWKLDLLQKIREWYKLNPNFLTVDLHTQ